MNIIVEERDITVDELLTAHKSGSLKEIFGTGTAVTVLPINGFGYRGKMFSIISNEEKTSDLLKIKLNNIQYAKTNDFSHWQYKIT
jgi:branched-chain amino acid aminotransferase